ncbi:uncharacterized protein [Ambystoma mexicanum]|uniref:uncharacterized protein n=1 Tax=Ambystoma mexicanum TaxID=8296 RepID=UPI0037E95F8C
MDDHIDPVKQVLNRLQKNNLLVKAEKCKFAVPSVQYLGYVLSEEGIAMDPDKVHAILDWSAPTSVRKVQRFLRLSNYYRRLIPNFSEVVFPITRLLKKEAYSFSWSTEVEESFCHLKSLFCSALIL